MNILYSEIEGNNHLGHIMLECLKTRKQDDIFQIDTATGEEETYGSVLTRTVAMARSLRRAGLQPGDVMVLSGRNHLNLRIPYYAALMNGLPVAGIDPGFKYEEIKRSLTIVLPKIAFCEPENYEIYLQAVGDLGLETKVFTFSEGRYSMAKYDTEEEKDEFRPSCFDTDKVYAWLISTSGTTGGALKFAAIKHGAAVIAIRNALIVKRFNINKRTEVTKPYKHGELWVKGPNCFTEYYNNPEETANAFTKDGWFKTGDILYRDDNGYFYFVERLKMLIKYRINHVYPSELEEVLETHPGVLEVCVTSIPHEEDGEWPVACVVRRPGRDVTAQEIKDLVADKLSDANQLRGGVFFMDSLPRNSTGKVCRPKIQEMVRTMKRE